MNVSLTPELERIVNAKVQSGLYRTASEVVREALRLLRDRGEGLERLRRGVRAGFDAAARGKFSEHDAKTSGARQAGLGRNLGIHRRTIGRGPDCRSGGSVGFSLRSPRCGVGRRDRDIRSSEEAYAFLTALKQTLQFIEVSTCDMEKGHLRCDANVSVRLRGAEKLGVKAEVKNLNSFRFLKLALDYEIQRQTAVLEAGPRRRACTIPKPARRLGCVPRKRRTTIATFRSRIWRRCGSATSGASGCWPRCRSCPPVNARASSRAWGCGSMTRKF